MSLMECREREERREGAGIKKERGLEKKDRRKSCGEARVRGVMRGVVQLKVAEKRTKNLYAKGLKCC